MLKLMKYEFRKSRTLILTLLGVIVTLEALFLYGMAATKENVLLIATVLLVLASYGTALAVFIMGVSSYSRELNQKSSYLIFMTPRSTLSIIGAELDFTLVTGRGFAWLLTGVAALDVPAFLETMGEDKTAVLDLIDSLMQQYDWSFARIILIIGFYAALIMASIVSTISVAYLAITLSATFMRGKKGHALVSVGLFVGINLALNWIRNALTRVTMTDIRTASDMIGGLWPSLIISLVMIAASIAVSAWMLKTKVDL